MKLRSVTLGNNLTWPLSAGEFAKAARFFSRARQLFEEAGVEVQTVRLATQPLRAMAVSPLDLAAALEPACAEAGIGYCSLGPAAPDAGAIAELIAASSNLFVSLPVAEDGQANIAACRVAGAVVHRVARGTDLGFGNLRFAALAHCRPNIPFFPASYHDGGHPKFSLALQGADIVVAAFTHAGTLAQAQERLAAGLVAADAQLTPAAKQLEREFAIEYLGADFSPAPFPTDEASIATAFQRIGLERFGTAGTLHVAAAITQAIRTAGLNRWGFNGLMLPVLEDAGLAAGTAVPDFTVNDLLLYSAVCGTGLDTVPLPGDTSADELAGIILDMAALSSALNRKPLTARLLPVPGKHAGERTAYSFEYFANGAVLATKGLSARGLLERG